MHQLLVRDGVNIAKINIFSQKRKKSNIFYVVFFKKKRQYVLQNPANAILHTT